MIAHLRSIIVSFIFFIGFELFVFIATLHNTQGVISACVLVCFLIFAGLNIGKRHIYSFLPAIVGIFSFALLYFIDNIQEQKIFGGIITILIYMSLLGIKRIQKNSQDMTARSLFSATLIATMFLFYAVVYGFYINFDISIWILMIVHFCVVSLITFMSLRAYSVDFLRTILYSCLIGFVMIQFSWMASFWPFSYLTMATISLMVYYILWDLVQMVFLQTLSKKRILITIIYCVILVLTVLLTTQWLLIG